MTTRFLLPFVHGVDKFAIEQAIVLAKSHDATLVPLALVYVPGERRKKGARLEYLQQSMDFLETVKQKADWYAVQIETLEIFTSDVVQSINLVAVEMECDGLILFVSPVGGVLLHTHQIKSLLEMPTCKLYITRLPSVERKNYAQVLRLRFSNWLSGRREQREGRAQYQAYVEAVAELSMKA